MSTGVVIVAAGSGKRMGGQRNKLWLPLAGEPILAHTVRLFATHPDIDEVVLVVSEADHAEVMTLISAEKLMVVITMGGAERQDSVRNGLASLSANCDYVLVHDAARPFVTRKQISDMIKQVQQDQATIMAVPVKDTIKVVGVNGLVESTPARESLWAVQTPQAFRMSLLREAHQAAGEAGKLGTDDAMLVEWLGHPVSIMQGSYENIKITTPDDLWFGEEILRKRKGE
ncbi:2-C-methyl-D-erythritol 4-phosphate cytidylyltransferase [Brevibacillus brevis NBRC 100599]|uniref:2-C-methyl-D-erythritol 4-phosphate cytidylyltransferase n=1 Tax=Brevibacillus brevis (strain 47 / JCM 6285 / NBRC 100599) TaxID=358681 RepID=C0ZIF3_BREBN|nr:MULTISPECIES: 2-C-methyl-D-erythritol 4-phosphate cytidylyltransferase [Bacillales]TQR29639.1 2-C-methyl-D-erythritol 4-phosphate cytidylyltransferase [Lysinibacillus sp. SDF0063]BAH41171.1 2-C-methyl-D-erythritol 4-phosphate cytidylyltransferase [Brevibacillus brevis NBRC 100599]